MVGGRFRDILLYPSTQKMATLLEHRVPCLRRKSPVFHCFRTEMCVTLTATSRPQNRAQGASKSKPSLCLQLFTCLHATCLFLSREPGRTTAECVAVE